MAEEGGKDQADTSIDQDLANMQQRAYRADIYSRLHRTNAQILEGSMRELIHGVKKPRPARVDETIPDEDVTSLRERVNEISDWVLKQNQDATTDPDYDGIDESLVNEEDKKNIFWFKKDNLSVTTDKESHPKSAYKLAVFFPNEQGNEVKLFFNHNGTFNLNIGFTGRNSRSRYSTGNAPLNEMSPEEHRVISYYLDQVKEKTIGPQSKGFGNGSQA